MCIINVIRLTIVLGPDESVLANLKQYGLERYYVDILVSDAAQVVWRCGDLFDAIVTDRKLLHYIQQILFVNPQLHMGSGKGLENSVANQRQNQLVWIS